MKTHTLGMNGKIALLALAALLLTMGSGAAEKTRNDSSIGQRMVETLQRRVALLNRLTADCEQQFKNGSLGGYPVLEAQIALYEAKLLLMKAEAGRPAVPGTAVAWLRYRILSGYAADFEKRYRSGQLALSSLLKAQLKANQAELDFLRCLQTGKYNAERLRRLSAMLGKPDPAVRLKDGFLRSLLEIEE